MNAAPRITIGRFIRFWEVRAMGMTHDQQIQSILVPFEPFDYCFFQFDPFLKVLCWTGRVSGTQDLQNFPDTSDNKSTHPPPLIIQQVPLVAMGEKDPLIRRHMMKD
jgi:hypothetical protein